MLAAVLRLASMSKSAASAANSRGDSLLLDMKVFDAQRVPGLQPYRLPNAFSHVARSPIPAILIRRLARVRRGGNVLFVPLLCGETEGKMYGRAFTFEIMDSMGE